MSAGLHHRMKELEGQAKELRISITEDKARLAELDAKLSEADLGTQTAHPKSSLDPNAVREGAEKESTTGIRWKRFTSYIRTSEERGTGTTGIRWYRLERKACLR
jgi:hypothetical protein